MLIPDISAADFSSQVQASRDLVLVDFYGTYCGACRTMLPLLEEVAGERSGTARIVKLNAEEHPQLAARYRVSALPSFVLFRGGEPVGQRVGTVSKRDLLAWIDDAAV